MIPPLVFLELHGPDAWEADGFGTAQTRSVLTNCRRLLAHARNKRWPIAFVTPLRNAGRRLGGGRSCWIEGFEPQRSDMIFDRTYPSCYSSREFADAITDAGNVFLIAGFSAECAGLATLIDAYNHGHQAGLIEDASATRALPGLSASDSHRAVMAIAGRYATLTTTTCWMQDAENIQSESEPDYDNADRG